MHAHEMIIIMVDDNTWRWARREATERARERGGRASSGEKGREWRRGRENLRVLKRRREEAVESKFILSVSTLKAPTSSTTILPPACSTAMAAADAERRLGLGRGSRKARVVVILGRG